MELLTVIGTCTSCGIRLLGEGNTVFPCPACGNVRLGRCPQCRDQGVTYACRECGFQGP
ncbi:MAG: zinc finger domain-containing protein [Methanobacteriota archaeon]